MSTTPNNQEPATNADLTGAIASLEERVLERLEKVETNMLTAFRTWARRSDTRQKASRS
ncbi:MAG TPA: hypothetical protein VH325_02195 [Bryobacteraceae bacterium]|jgi:hypothetical protein|nr:hypothetical protein [Bryobacteraceae bacterium]